MARELLRRLKQRALGSNIVWRLSGLTYRTAVIATRGAYIPPDGYLEQSRSQTGRLERFLSPGTVVLELGCGIGGNLISVNSRIRHGFGIDPNPGYIRIARSLSKRVGSSNLDFMTFDGETLPTLPAVDFAFSIGVFERLPKALVRREVQAISKVLKPGGTFAAYFLSDRVLGSLFTKRLGDRAYVVWGESELEQLFSEYELKLLEVSDWRDLDDRFVIAHMCISTKKTSTK